MTESTVVSCILDATPLIVSLAVTLAMVVVPATLFIVTWKSLVPLDATIAAASGSVIVAVTVTSIVSRLSPIATE